MTARRSAFAEAHGGAGLRRDSALARDTSTERSDSLCFRALALGGGSGVPRSMRPVRSRFRGVRASGVAPAGADRRRGSRRRAR